MLESCIIIRLQACVYKKTRHSEYKQGIACVKFFNENDVLWIIDKNGNKLREIWNYELRTYNYTTPNFLEWS